MSSRTQLAVLAAALLSACAATSPRTSLVGSNAPYFVGQRAVIVDREYLHRYSCANGSLLDCRCATRLGSCHCWCP